jgi:hypothetical protein
MKKPVLVAAAAVLAVVAIAGGALLAVNPSWSPLSGVRDHIDGTYAQRQADVKQAEVVKHDALSLIPADAFIVSHASMTTMTGDWWKTYAALMPKNVSLPSSLADLGVTAITYAVSPNNSPEYAKFNPTGTEIILAVSPSSDPEAVVAAINEAAGPGALFVTTSTGADATYVIVSDVPSWEQVDALARGTSKIDTFDTRTQASSLKVNSEEPFMFVDMSSYLKLMTSYVKDNPDSAKFVATLLDSGLGMTGDTTWLGTTTDGGLHWEGAFLTGGVSKDKINIDAYQKAVSDQIQFIPSEGSATAAPSDGSGGVLQYGYVIQGLSTTADAVSISTGGKSTGAVINPHDMGAKPVVAQATGSDIVVVFSPQMFQAAFQGVINPYSIHTVTVTVKGDSDKVLIDFTLYKESDYNTTDSNPGPSVAPSPSATP